MIAGPTTTLSDLADAPESRFDEQPTWHTTLAPYAEADVVRSVTSVMTSVVPFLALWAAMYLALGVSYWLVLALAIPTAGFLVRTFVIFHDCTHGSLFRNRRDNQRVGALLGMMVFTPFAMWRHEHLVHHATAGDLDRRFVGDVPTLTTAEYGSWSWPKRLGYRLFRNPLVLFGFVPLLSMVLIPRAPKPGARPNIRHSVWLTDLALVLVIAGLCAALGWREFLLVWAPLLPLAGGTGIWLFYVQHQFADAYWEHSPAWSYDDAALRGSSYLRLPRILQFFTANIGFHHVHHLNPGIPHYNLERAHLEVMMFRDVPELSVWDGLKTARLKLWDEDRQRLLTWAQYRRARQVGVPGGG